MHEGANISAGSYQSLGFGGQIGAHNRYADVVNQTDHVFIIGGMDHQLQLEDFGLSLKELVTTDLLCLQII